MKRSILTTFAVMAIAASATFAQYYGYWSPVTVFEPAVSTNIPGDWDGTFTLVYRISVSGDAFAWTPDVEDERADVCEGNLVKQAQVSKIRDTGYLFIKFASDVAEEDSCSDSAMPWSWICASTSGVVPVVDMWIQLDTAKPWQTPEGPTALPLDEYIMYAALQRNAYAFEMPSMDFNVPVWQPQFNWDFNWGECKPEPDICTPTWDYDYIQPATALLKIYASIDPEDADEWAVIDLISGPAKQTPLNRVIGTNCCTAQVFVAQTFKGGMISMGAPYVDDNFTPGFGTVTDWYNEWENCPEDLVLCLDLRLDSAMTKAHNECEYTPDVPGGGCTPNQTGRSGFGLW